MSSTRKSASSMSGVWATLNAMKARQASAATAHAKHKSTDVQRKSALSAFETSVSRGGESADVLKRAVSDHAVRAVVDAHKDRIRNKGSAGVADELEHLKRSVKAAGLDLAVVAERLRAANELAHRMDKVGSR